MDEQKRTVGLKRMCAYVVELQPLMRLSHWHIEVPDVEPETDAWADVVRLQHAQDAVIRLSDQHFDNTPEQQRETIVHELLHCHLRDLIGVPQMIKQEISLPLFAALGDRISHEEECLVDALAQLLAPLLPLPPVKANQEHVA